MFLLAKNLILAGIGSLSLIDETICSINDMGTQFYINEHQVTNKLTR